MLSFATLFVFMLMQDQEPLAGLRWKNRVLILSADSESPALLQKQVKDLAADHPGLTERKLEVYILEGETGKTPQGKTIDKKGTAAMRKAYSIAPDGFRVTLIGLDGGVKQSWKKPVLPAEVYRLIDAMPMRRNER